jgi:hypothetical protein
VFVGATTIRERRELEQAHIHTGVPEEALFLSQIQELVPRPRIDA